MDLINGRTAEEIKRGLRWIANDCDECGEDCSECECVKECHTMVEDDVAKDALALIERLEAAVPVVRCKDCKHRGGYHCPMFYEELWSYDEDSSKWIEHDKTVDNGYCERGEKIGR